MSALPKPKTSYPQAVAPLADRPTRVLYMEDDSGLARLFQKHLERFGYQVDLAADGSSGLALYETGQYDVLAVDYKMPVQDGLDVITHLSSLGKLPPTIMLTANGDEALAVEALKLGASDYIVKDTAGGYIRLLPSVIERLLEKHRLEEGRQRAQEALRLSEERLREITESATDAIISFSEAGKIVLWNSSAEALLGYRAEESADLLMENLVGDRFRDDFARRLEEMWSGQRVGKPLEVVVLHRAGHEVSVEMSLSASKTSSGLLTTCILRDITSRLQTQQAQQEAARLDATATLAGGIAHQFNNLLFGVLGNTELLLMRLEDRPDATGRLQALRQQAERASELVQQMLAFARRGHYHPVLMNLNDTLKEVTLAWEGELPEGVALHRKVDAELWPIFADPTQMAQLIMNLSNNALEALEDQGNVRLEFANAKVDSRHRLNAKLKPGRYVRLSVTDDGCGMSPDVLAKIYTPFFTTKFSGRGLGLAAVWGITQSHNGAIEVRSTEGQGTAVEVHLPAMEPPLASASKLPEKRALPRGKETVLLVDEEEVFRNVAKELLEFLGYRVLEAVNGTEAKRLAQDYPGKIPLALLDVNMAAPGSRQTFTNLVEARPEIQILLCSGHHQDHLAKTLLQAGATALLCKPFGLEVLAFEVRRALDSP
ncbi:MAG: response regulator [Deltaproteobacteria bacterium]|nr:response regulator [Deltaproteobacteria bacterium]